MADEDFKIDLDEKAIAKEAPVFVRGQVEKAIARAEDAINTADFNKDGKADIGQIYSFAMKAAPLFIALNAAIDFEKAADKLVEQDFIKDKAQLVTAIKTLASLAEDAGSLFPIK